MAQPTLPTWADGDPSYVIEPGSAKKTVGWLSGEKPPYQYMNWIHNATSTYLTYLEDKILSNAPAMVRSSSAASWNGSTLTLTDPLDISFRVEDGEQLNRLAAGSYAFSDGQVLVVKKDLTNASPVTLGSGSYGSLAEGDYVIVTETSLTGDDWENETIVLRRKGSDLENVLSGEIYESGASIDWGKTSLTNASINDASNTSVTRVFSATHTTTGTAAAGIGTEIALLAENAAGTSVLTASLQGVFSDVTNGSEDSYLDFYTISGGSSKRDLRLTESYSQFGSTSGSYELLIGRSATANGTGRLYFLNSNTQKNWKISHNDVVAGGFEIAQETSSGSETFSNPYFTIASTGLVGIGTNSADQQLEVLRAGTQLRLTYTDGSVYSDFAVNSSGYYSNIATGNRYGLGVSSPLATLHVKGASGAATVARIAGDTGFNGTLQLTDGVHGYALIYDYTNNDFVINYDSTIGTGTQECARWNEAGEMLLPDVSNPVGSVNHTSRRGPAKAWANMNGTTVTKGFNVASASGAAPYVLTFSTAMSDANYCAIATTPTVGVIAHVTAKSTTTVSVTLTDLGTGLTVPGLYDIIIFGT